MIVPDYKSRRINDEHSNARYKSLQEMAAQEAIVIRNARKCYTKNVPVLDNLNMVVSRGSIYGLLGSSGCGKTTLLSCVVGVRNLDGGDIWVLGGKPGSKGSGIPGPRVGYMPQDISLVKEFTTSNALYYFGRISGVEDAVIEERLSFLTNLLQLPPRNKQVKHMSGGQQRRVSFAAAMVHRPELLILDEPTVGLDPVLRSNIWNYLIKITKEDHTAVVITTHYIEEAKQADRIAMMRCGQILAESTPGQILAEFQCQTLEQAFLTLSQKQADNLKRGITEVVNELPPEISEVTSSTVSLNNSDYNSTENIMGSEKHKVKRKEINNKTKQTYRVKKFKALMIKNILQLVKHPGGVAFAILFPILQTFLFFNAIGRDPKDLHMAVVNEEAGNCNNSKLWGEINYDPETQDCNLTDISCRYLKGFDDSVVIKDYYPDEQSAYEAVTNGRAVGFIYFRKNFSEALQGRTDFGSSASDEDLENSEIQISLDMGNRQTGLWLKTKLFERYSDVQKGIMEACHLSPKLADLPLKFEDPIFGEKDQKFSMFMAPGFLMTVIYFLSTSLTAAIIITDRIEGVWDRSLVTGVSTPEILAAHVLLQFSLTLIQVIAILLVSFVGFDLECKGPLLGVIVLMLLMGFCGMCYGFCISVMVSTHTVANYVSTGTFYPLILLSGCIWPIEGMPIVLQWLSKILPTTLPSISMRAILERGYSIDESQVYSGFLIIGSWIICFVILCLIGLRSKTAG